MSNFLHRCFWDFMSSTCKYWPDSLWLKFIFWTRFHRYLNLSNPKSFNEKMNWLKLYDRNPKYVKLANKYEVKQYVRDKIGDEYIVPCYGVWDSFDEIDFSVLPNQFVLKCTHDSGGMCICKDKSKFDKITAKEKLERTLNNNFFWWTREWPYKKVKPQILADKFLDDHTGKTLLDYKFWCFSGKPTYMYFTVKSNAIFENFYDMDFMPIAINHGFKRKEPEFEKPLNFELMKSLAATLSKGIPFVRIDFFQVDGKVYFGEFTFYDWAGLRPFIDWNQDLELGSFITLPSKKR